MGVIDSIKSMFTKRPAHSPAEQPEPHGKRGELRGVRRLTWAQVKAIKPSPGRMIHVSKPIPEGLADAMRLTLSRGISLPVVQDAARLWLKREPGFTRRVRA